MPKKFTAESTVAEVLTSEKGRQIITEYFNDICLTCPGVATETLAVSAHFHGIDIDTLLKKLNAASRRAAGASHKSA